MRKFLLPLLIAVSAICALVIAAALLLLSPAAARALGLPLACLSAAALCAALFLRRAGGEGEEKLKAACEELDAAMARLSAGLTKLSTGDLAARVEPFASSAGARSRAPEVKPGAEPSRASTTESLVASISSRAEECIGGFNAVTDEPCRRLLYVGTDSYEEGQAMGGTIGEALSGKGSVAVILGDYRSVNLALRRRGMIDALAERFPSVAVVDTAETRESADIAYRAVRELLERHPGLSAVYAADGATPPAAAKAVEDAHLQGKVLVFGHDLTEETMAMIAKGGIAASLSQDPYAQGYNPVIHLYNHLAAGWNPVAPRMLTKLEAITKDNFARFRDPGSAGSRLGLASALVPRDGSRKPRIAVILPPEEGFWAPVRQGAKEAGEELAARGAEVSCFSPPASRGADRSAANYAPLVERLAREGWEGIAMPIFDRALVPTINSAVAKGVAVASLNCEPVSLRETVTAASTHAQSLIDMSVELAASAEESGQSTLRIGGTVRKIGDSVRSQSKEVARTREELGGLAESIAKAKDSAEKGSAIASRVAAASKDGFAAVSSMKSTVESLAEASQVAEGTIRALAKDSDKIGGIVASIAEIANQTNILAINASIQAARAGEQGKGFAVIAAEIRKLAEQSNRAAEEISRVISAIGGRVRAAAEATSRGLEKAKENAEHAELSEKSLVDITSFAAESERGMAVIFSAVETMVSFSKGFELAVRELSTANEGSSAAADEIEAATKEMATQATDVASTAQSLSEMAKAQQMLFSQFRLAKQQ